jgi:hypothetical protein
MRYLIAAAFIVPSLASAQGTAERAPERAIRRDIPITNAITRAYEAGTRDSSGRPGRNYWQLRTDYTIQARLDPTTQTITGSETITLHNESPTPLAEIRLRLDHNIFRPTAPQGLSTPAETTEGMVVTKITVNGSEADLTEPAQGGRGHAVSPVVSGTPSMRLRFCTAAPDAPLPRLS